MTDKIPESLTSIGSPLVTKSDLERAVKDLLPLLEGSIIEQIIAPPNDIAYEDFFRKFTSFLKLIHQEYVSLMCEELPQPLRVKMPPQI